MVHMDSCGILCIDFGTTSWGCAVGDIETQVAQAVGAVPAQQGNPNWEKLDQLVQEWAPTRFVMGYPLKADGSPFDKLTPMVDRAAKSLSKRYQHPVDLQDERLTTVHAKERIYAQKGKKGLTKSSVDAESARIILEHYFGLY